MLGCLGQRESWMASVSELKTIKISRRGHRRLTESANSPEADKYSRMGQVVVGVMHG